MQPKLCDCGRGTRIAFRVVVARFDGTILDTTALCATCLNQAARTLAELDLHPGQHEEDQDEIDVV
jgi:beta-phosphoglucomutase-like phosphatase (HAD superfamily)